MYLFIDDEGYSRGLGKPVKQVQKYEPLVDTF